MFHKDEEVKVLYNGVYMTGVIKYIAPPFYTVKLSDGSFVTISSIYIDHIGGEE